MYSPMTAWGPDCVVINPILTVSAAGAAVGPARTRPRRQTRATRVSLRTVTSSAACGTVRRRIVAERSAAVHRRASCDHCPELVPLELSGHGPRQLGDDADAYGPLVSREPRGQRLAQRRHQIDGRRRGRDDERERLHQAAITLCADHPGLEHARMLEESRLDVSRPHPHPGDLEEVVLTPAMDEGTVSVTRVDVPRPEPSIREDAA